jgi:hypothetical protein
MGEDGEMRSLQLEYDSYSSNHTERKERPQFVAIFRQRHLERQALMSLRDKQVFIGGFIAGLLTLSFFLIWFVFVCRGCSLGVLSSLKIGSGIQQADDYRLLGVGGLLCACGTLRNRLANTGGDYNRSLHGDLSFCVNCMVAITEAISNEVANRAFSSGSNLSSTGTKKWSHTSAKTVETNMPISRRMNLVW